MGRHGPVCPAATSAPSGGVSEGAAAGRCVRRAATISARLDDERLKGATDDALEIVEHALG